MALLDDLDRRREVDLQNRENSARLAQAFAIFETTGQGSIQFEERVDFGFVFIEKPVVTYGAELDVDDLADVLDIEDTDDVVLPLCSGFVVNWDQDERDFYTGCWIAARVHFPRSTTTTDDGDDGDDGGPVISIARMSTSATSTDVDPAAKPYIEHHFTFAAIAMKDIPVDRDDATDD